jgi:hypothetical protein
MDASARSHLSCALQRYRLGCCVLICPKGRFPTGLAFSQPDRSILTWSSSSRFRDIKAPAGRVRIPHDLKPSTVKKFKTTIYDMRLKSLNVTVFLSLVSLASGTCVLLCVGGAEVTDCRGRCAGPPCYLSEWEERLQRQVLRSVPHPRGHPGESVRSRRMRRRCALGPAYRLPRRHWVFHDEKRSVCFPFIPRWS